MATFDLTSKNTVGASSDSIAALPGHLQRNNVYLVDKVMDLSKSVAQGYTFTSGDVFQLLEIPANTLVLAAGAEVVEAFNGTAPVVDIDFAGGDDIVDGASVASTGWLAGGTNGQGMIVGGVPSFTQLVTTTDTIDVTLTAGAADVTSGVIRVVAVLVDVSPTGKIVPTETARDQLA